MEQVQAIATCTTYHSVNTSPMTYSSKSSSSPRHKKHSNISSQRLSISSSVCDERVTPMPTSSTGHTTTNGSHHSSYQNSDSGCSSINGVGSSSTCEYKTSPVKLSYKQKFSPKGSHKSNRRNTKRSKAGALTKSAGKGQDVSSRGKQECDRVSDEMINGEDNPREPIQDVVINTKKSSLYAESITDKEPTISHGHQTNLFNGQLEPEQQLMMVTQVDSSPTPLSNGHNWHLCGSSYSDLEEDDVFQDALSNLPSICSSTSSSAFHTPLSTRSQSPVNIRHRLSSPHEHTPSTGSSSTLSCESSLTRVCDSLQKVLNDQLSTTENGSLTNDDELLTCDSHVTILPDTEVDGDLLSYCPVSFTHNSMISTCEGGSRLPRKTSNSLQNHGERITSNGNGTDNKNNSNGVFQMYVGDLKLTIHNTNDACEDIDFEGCSTKVHIHDLDHDEGEDSGCSMSIGSPIKGSLDRKRPGVLHVVPHVAPGSNNRNNKKTQNSTTSSSGHLQSSPIHHNSFDFSSISTASPQSSVYSHSSSPPLILSPSPTPPHHTEEEVANGDVIRNFITTGSSCNNEDFIANDGSVTVGGEDNGAVQEEEWPSFDGTVNSPAPPRATMSFTNGLIYPTTTPNGIPLAVPVPGNPSSNIHYPPPPLMSPPIAMMTFAPSQYHHQPLGMQPMPVVSQTGGVENGSNIATSQSQLQQQQQQPPSSSASSSNDHQKITSYIKAQLAQLEMFQRLNQYHQRAAVAQPFFGSFGHLPPQPPPSFRPHPTGQTGFTGHFPPPPPALSVASTMSVPTVTNHGLNWTPVPPPPQQPPSNDTSPPPLTLHPSPPPTFDRSQPHTSPHPTVYDDDHSIIRQSFECSEVEEQHSSEELGDQPDSEHHEVEPVRELHPLTDSWVVWYDRITGRGRNKLADYKNTLNKVCTVACVEDFWRLYNNIKPPSELTVNANYHFFKEGVDPLWEDPANKSGGQWVLTIKDGPQLMDKIWMEVLLALVGGSMRNSQLINGAVLSRRKNGNRIALWTSRKTKKTNLDICKDLLKALCYGYEGSINNLPQFVRQLSENRHHMVFGFKHHGDSLKSGHSHHTDFHITLKDHLDEILTDFES